MTFKLVGDQNSGIKLIQKRRVAELLAGHIPADEALLMRNGKYACLVCRHRPTFDTITTLSIHRDGQRHIAEQAQAATRHVLMAGVPYTSLAARSRKKEGGGGGDRGEPFFSRKRCAQGSTLGGELLDLERHKNYTTPGPQTKHRRSIHAGTSSGQEEQTGPITGTSSGQEEQTGPITEQLISTNGDIPVHEVQTAVEAVGVSCNAPIQEGVSVYKERVGLTKEQQKEYTKYRSSGWIRGFDGSWGKDPDVEFDSDEEPPQL